MATLTRTILLFLAACVMCASAAQAQEASKTVSGIEINYGVVPAKVIAAPTDKHDPKMHGGRRFGAGSHHLVVALSDPKTGQRISDATVVATVTPLGMAPVQKQLQPMLINETTTYGNFFDFPPSSAPFRIELRITRPSISAHDAVAAEFEYRPPTTR